MKYLIVLGVDAGGVPKASRDDIHLVGPFTSFDALYTWWMEHRHRYPGDIRAMHAELTQVVPQFTDVSAANEWLEEQGRLLR